MRLCEIAPEPSWPAGCPGRPRDKVPPNNKSCWLVNLNGHLCEANCWWAEVVVEAGAEGKSRRGGGRPIKLFSVRFYYDSCSGLLCCSDGTLAGRMLRNRSYQRSNRQMGGLVGKAFKEKETQNMDRRMM